MDFKSSLVYNVPYLRTDGKIQDQNVILSVFESIWALLSI